MAGWYVRGTKRQRVGGIGESMAACGFSYMGQRGARGQSLRASWQWQHQCQTLEEERTCMMVSPKVWEHGGMVSLLGPGGLDSQSIETRDKVTQSVFTEWICRRFMETNHRIISSHWYWESSDLFRPDKVSKSLIARFWGSKLLMITVRLSGSTLSISRTSACRQGYKSKRQRGETRRQRHRLGALDIMV